MPAPESKDSVSAMDTDLAPAISSSPASSRLMHVNAPLSVAECASTDDVAAEILRPSSGIPSTNMEFKRNSQDGEWVQYGGQDGVQDGVQHGGHDGGQDGGQNGLPDGGSDAPVDFAGLRVQLEAAVAKRASLQVPSEVYCAKLVLNGDMSSDEIRAVVTRSASRYGPWLLYAPHVVPDAVHLHFPTLDAWLAARACARRNGERLVACYADCCRPASRAAPFVVRLMGLSAFPPRVINAVNDWLAGLGAYHADRAHCYRRGQELCVVMDVYDAGDMALIEAAARNGRLSFANQQVRFSLGGCCYVVCQFCGQTGHATAACQEKKRALRVRFTKPVNALYCAELCRLTGASYRLKGQRGLPSYVVDFRWRSALASNALRLLDACGADVSRFWLPNEIADGCYRCGDEGHKQSECMYGRPDGWRPRASYASVAASVQPVAAPVVPRVRQPSPSAQLAEQKYQQQQQQSLQPPRQPRAESARVESHTSGLPRTAAHVSSSPPARARDADRALRSVSTKRAAAEAELPLSPRASPRRRVAAASASASSTPSTPARPHPARPSSLRSVPVSPVKPVPTANRFALLDLTDLSGKDIVDDDDDVTVTD